MRRREFLKGSSAIVVAGAVPALFVASTPLAANARSFRRGRFHSLANYRECIGTWFYVLDHSWKRVMLIEVHEHAVSFASLDLPTMVRPSYWASTKLQPMRFSTEPMLIFADA